DGFDECGHHILDVDDVSANAAVPPDLQRFACRGLVYKNLEARLDGRPVLEDFGVRTVAVHRREPEDDSLNTMLRLIVAHAILRRALRDAEHGVLPVELEAASVLFGDGL